MSVGTRIKQLRKMKKLSQGDLAIRLGMDNSQLSKVERDILKPTLEQLMELSSILNTTIDFILKGESAYTDNSGVMVVNDKHTNYQKTPHVVTTDDSLKDNIVLVAENAHAGYLVGYNDPDFIKSLPTYKVPNLRNGIFRMFQVKGSSMIPTIHDRSFVIGQFVEDWINGIYDNRIYIIVSKEDGLIVKRCLNRIVKYGHIYCKSDNRKEFPNISLNPEDIQEIWELKMLLAFEFTDPADLYDRVSDLEAEVMFLKSPKP